MRLAIIPSILVVLLLAGCSENQIVGVDDDDTTDPSGDDDDTSIDDDDTTPDRAPTLVVQPTSYGFGERPLGCPAEVVFRVTNLGDAELLVYDIALTEPSGTGELVLVDGPASAVLLPGEFVDLVVRHVAMDSAADVATLRLSSNDPSTPIVDVGLTGAALPTTPASDTWLQEGDRTVDVLWIVDNSCSMAFEQEALGDNFGAFLDVVDALELDYHVGVVSTDADDDGILQGSPRFVTPTTPDREDAFEENVALGQLGSGTEQGLDMALAALTGDHVEPGGANDGFLRDSAGLRLVFVSDEDDSSWDLSEPQDYIDAFTALKVNPAHVIASDITGGPTGCVSDTANADPAPAYLEVTGATGGLSTLICDAGWVSTLTELAWLSDSRADTFGLSQPAAPGSALVWVADVAVLEGWTFDESLNAIVFEPDSVPSEGSLVSTEYLLAQECSD